MLSLPNKSKTLKPQNVKLLFFYIFIANAPDLDFLPGLIIGKPNLYHHGISHSLGIGILFSLILAFIIVFNTPSACGGVNIGDIMQNYGIRKNLSQFL